MSKAVKRKISVELQQKPSSKSRLSVFERLGTKKSKSILKSIELKSLTDDFKQTLSAAVNIKPSLSINKPDVELDDAETDLLEKKRQEIQKELELQMKMESRRTAAIRKRKRAPSSTESSSSTSESESSSSSSSSSSSDDRHKSRKLKGKHRDSSSSSDEYAKKIAKKKRSCQSKKDAQKMHKLSKKHSDLASVSRKSKRHSTSPTLSKKHRSDSSTTLMMSPSGQKVMVKNLKVSTTIDKHHRMKEIDRTELLQREQKERERERLRMREERIHDSRSPKLRRSRSPKREFLRRSPVMRRSQSPKSGRSMSRRMDTEQDRRDKDRDLAREKERREALLRCQERQRERERVAKDAKSQRLLPRPAERAAMALAAAQERRSPEKDHVPYGGRNYAERPESFDHRRHVKDGREHDRPYENRREPNEYQHTGPYRREWNEPAAKERDWHDENSTKDMYDRHQGAREWDHKRGDNVRPTVETYADRKDWSENSGKWESRKGSSWQQDTDSNWGNRYKEENWQDSNQQSTQAHHSRPINEKPTEHTAPSAISKPISSLGRRWNTWRGRGRGSHHGDFRRSHHHTEILEERGEIYRRHINPQGANAAAAAAAAAVTKPAARKSIDSQPQATDKTSDETSKVSNQDENAEEIADDLSEISDEADEFLGQQEESQSKSQPIEKITEKPTTEGSELSQTTQGPPKELNDTETEKEPKEEEKAATQERTVPKSPEENDRSKDLGEDIDLDFEEISDGELEEEARIKGLGDALGVDWASLVEESKAKLQEKLSQTETSAKQRWHPNQILLDTGISYKMAGKAFAQQHLLRAYETIKKDAQKINDIKTENIDEDIKMEQDDSEPKTNGKHADDDSEKVPKLHPLPCIQTSTINWAQKQQRLIFNASGPYSRGLSTKRDIAMRRQLCHLAINETNSKSVNVKKYSGYENIAMKLFQKALQT